MAELDGKVLVTGGAGFIGSHLAETLLKKGCEVVIADNLATGARENLPEGAKFCFTDVTDEAAVESLFVENPGIRYVAHLAAYVNLAESMRKPALDAKNNVVGTLNVLAAAKKFGVEQLAFSSSAAVYGNPQYIPVDENHPINPTCPYGWSKYASEKYMEIVGEDLKIVRFRFSCVYGPRQNVLGRGEGGVVSIFLRKIENNLPVELRGHGNPVRDYVYVSDVVNGLVLGLSGQPGIYNLGTGENSPVTVKQLWEQLSAASLKYVGQLPEASYVPMLPGELEKMIVSIKNAKEGLGWEPKVAFSEGVVKTADYFFQSKNK